MWCHRSSSFSSTKPFEFMSMSGNTWMMRSVRLRSANHSSGAIQCSSALLTPRYSGGTVPECATAQGSNVARSQKRMPFVSPGCIFLWWWCCGGGGGGGGWRAAAARFAAHAKRHAATCARAARCAAAGAHGVRRWARAALCTTVGNANGRGDWHVRQRAPGRRPYGAVHSALVPSVCCPPWLRRGMLPADPLFRRHGASRANEVWPKQRKRAPLLQTPRNSSAQRTRAHAAALRHDPARRGESKRFFAKRLTCNSQRRAESTHMWRRCTRNLTCEVMLNPRVIR